jgi:uncharacterized protein YgbK (DUF1537 family)
MLDDRRDDEIHRVAAKAAELLASKRLAVVSTPRLRLAVADDPLSASLVTDSLAKLTQLLASDATMILFKGGITSAVGIRQGLGGDIATVEGPIRPGVSLWRLENGRRCIVFPGNLGADDLLSEVVNEVLT